MFLSFHAAADVVPYQQNKQRLQDEFFDLVLTLKLRLENKVIYISDFRIFMTTFLDVGKILTNKNSVKDIIEAISSHKLWDYTCADALKHIHKRFIGDDDSEFMVRLKNHQREVEQFHKRIKALDYNRDTKADGNYHEAIPGRIVMAIKYQSFTNISLDGIYEKWPSLRRALFLPPCPVLLQDVNPGCLEVTWLVPTVFAHQMRAYPSELSRVFRQQKITRAMMGDEVLYAVENEVSVIMQ